MTFRHVVTAAAGLLLAGFIGAAPASAQGLGLAGIHDWVRVGNKICMKDHFHDGSSSGQPSRKAAEAAAIGVWQGFTAWEYGANWGSFRMAESRGIKCDQSSNGWGCQVTARPCKRR